MRFRDTMMSHRDKSMLFGASGLIKSYSDVLALGDELSFTRRRLVACLIDNSVDGIAAYLAILISNAVPLMLSESINGKQLDDILALYKPRYILLPGYRRDELKSAEYIMDVGGHCLLDLHNSNAYIHESLALLLGTSGSTGSPKFVRLSHENVLSNARSISQYLGLSSDDIPITTLPPSYTYGLSIIHSHILVGATIAVTNKTFFDRGFWNFLKEVKATSFGGVPYHYEMLKKLRFTKMDLPGLKTLTQAGGRMEPELTKEFATHCQNHGMRFFTMYGQAEATARMSYLPAEKSVSKAGSIGIAIPGGKFWLENENGQVIDRPETAGELVYEGPNVSMGYAYGYEDLAKGDERGGVLRTGDLAKRDTDGDYYIVGRLKRFIKLFGHRVNLLDVEKYLLDAGYVAACAGKDDRLEIYLTGPSDTQAVCAKRLVLDYLQVAVSGVEIYGIQALPRNESGKIRYGDLRPELGTLLA